MKKQLAEAIETIESFNPRRVDKLTVEQIEALHAEAERTGGQVDWETGKVIPKPGHHQRDTLAAIETRKQRRRDENDAKDNAAESAEQAGW